MIEQITQINSAGLILIGLALIIGLVLGILIKKRKKRKDREINIARESLRLLYKKYIAELSSITLKIDKMLEALE